MEGSSVSLVSGSAGAIGKPNGIRPDNTIIFLMDDRTARPERRAKVADLIIKAAQDGAKAIIIDAYYLKASNYDSSLEKAFNVAKNKGVKIIIAAGPNGEKPVFKESENVRVGHIVAQTDGNDNPPNPNYFHPLFKGYTAIPWIIAQRFPQCNNPADIPLQQKITYKDLKGPEAISYNDYKTTDMRGKFVFVGGSINPDSGNRADQVTTDQGKITHGVYDLFSASVAYSEYLCGPK